MKGHSHASPTKPHPKAKCKGCGARMLKPSKTGLCTFCEVETGVKKPL